MAEMPTLPQVGQLDWGPDVNDCLVWLYEQMAANNSMITELQAQVLELQLRKDYVYDSALWIYHNGAPPSPDQQVRANTSTIAQATLLDFRLIDFDGMSRKPLFNHLSPTSIIRICDWDDPNRYARFRVLSAPVFTATNAEVGVQLLDANSTIASNAQVDAGFFIDARGLGI